MAPAGNRKVANELLPVARAKFWGEAAVGVHGQADLGAGFYGLRRHVVEDDEGVCEAELCVGQGLEDDLAGSDLFLPAV